MYAHRLTLVTNIPSPYRLHGFAVLQQELQSRNIMLEVLFMAKSERGRYWSVNSSEWRFNGQLVRGLHPSIRNIEMHINPGIWYRVLKDLPDWLIIGGGWQFPTSLGLYALRRIYRSRTYSLAWTEANYSSSRQLYGLVANLRRALLQNTDGMIVPGQIASQTLREYWGLQNPKTVYYPNLVDETVYRDKVAILRLKRAVLRDRHHIPQNFRVLFWSARLEESAKGILNFLKAVEPLILPNLLILIAGEGPDRQQIAAWISVQPKMKMNVRLLGHLTQDQLLEHLALADVSILPSLRDPNPLSIIEALWSGLPILTSINCGNYPETVQTRKNGWLVDPLNSDSLRTAFGEIVDASARDLSLMGRHSVEIAEQGFNSKIMTSRFVDDLLLQFPPKSTFDNSKNNSLDMD
jgi:glycosyltransferase involved in cell wall biosynthesis